MTTDERSKLEDKAYSEAFAKYKEMQALVNKMFKPSFDLFLDEWFKLNTNVKSINWEYIMESDDEGGGYPSWYESDFDFGNHPDKTTTETYKSSWGKDRTYTTSHIHGPIKDGLLEMLYDIREEMVYLYGKTSKNPYFIDAPEQEEEDESDEVF